MGPVNARACVDALEAAGHSLAALKSFKPPQGAALDYPKLVELLTTLATPERPWAGQMRLVRDWYKPHLERIYEHFHTRVGDLDQLEQLATQYPSRERFITELTLDPPQVTSDLAGQPLLDEDYLVLSTIHSAKGMEWDTVYVLNVVDGSFPSEFATGKPEMIDEERRLLYVAMTRARNELHLVSPLRFAITSAPRASDAHVYGGRSRFVTDKVLSCFEEGSFAGSHLGDSRLNDAARITAIDAAAKLKEMW